MATHSNILPGKFHGQRSLVGYSPQGRKELNMIEAIKHTCTHSAYKLNKQGDNIQPCRTLFSILKQLFLAIACIRISFLFRAE